MKLRPTAFGKLEMRSQKATAKIEDTSVMRQTRRDLARVETERTVRRARPLTEAE